MSDRRSLIAWTGLVVVGLLVVAGASVLEPVGRDGNTGLVMAASIVFVVVFVLAGFLIFTRGLSLIAESRQAGTRGSGTPDIRGLIRGVRLMFLSVATFVAAGMGEIYPGYGAVGRRRAAAQAAYRLEASACSARLAATVTFAYGGPTKRASAAASNSSL